MLVNKQQMHINQISLGNAGRDNKCYNSKFGGYVGQQQVLISNFLVKMLVSSNKCTQSNFFGSASGYEQQMLIVQISAQNAGYSATNANNSNFFGLNAGKMQQC
jgi:hypothetical protein